MKKGSDFFFYSHLSIPRSFLPSGEMFSPDTSIDWFMGKKRVREGSEHTSGAVIMRTYCTTLISLEEFS